MFSFFLIEISLKLKCVSFSGVQNNKKKQLLREIVNCVSYHRVLADENLILVLYYTFF